MPQGWQAQEGTTAWKVTDGPPRLDTPAFDSFSRSPDADPRILVGKRLVRDSAPLDQWIAEMRASNSITYPADVCNPVEDQGATSLGGESAQMLAFHCPTDGPKAVAVQILARHGDSGWVVQCFSSTVEAGSLSSLEQQCGRWLSSFRFAS